MKLVTFTLLVGVAACARARDNNNAPNGSAASTVPAAPTPAPAGAPAGVDADTRARTLLQQQINLALAGKHDDLVATFSKDAIVLAGDDNVSTADQVNNFAIGGGGADGASIDKASIAKLVARGTKDAVWFYAEVSTHSTGPGGGPGIGSTRVVELLTAASSWHVAAASFDSPDELTPAGMNTEIAGATGAPALAQTLATPSKLGAQLASDAVAIGPTSDQVATSDAAKALASWKLEPITLFKNAREVKGSGWAFAQASFDRPHPGRPTLTDRGLVQLFAVPKPDGSWSIVLVQYRRQ
ncbi:MAG TPA: hypothetical protein VH143_30605 [Kofleriaceae bacterium]|jgi:hypothetical protein|nr:hypothetical protein [Kofleriaceae bacterium]